MSYLLDLYHRDLEKESQRKTENAKLGSIFYRRLKARFEKGQNSNVVVTGEPGLGKSAASLVCGEDLKPEIFVDHPEDAVERYVTFTGAEFGRAVKNSPNGSVITGDEWGQQMHHRRFMSEPNVQLSNVMQGYRYKRYYVFLNLPGLPYLDVDAQGLLTYQMNLLAQGRAEIFRVFHPKFRGDDYRKTEVDTWRFRKPRPALWKAYLAKKEKNQEQVVDRAIRAMDREEKVEYTDQEIAAMIREDPKPYTKGGEISYARIQGKFGVGITRAYVVKDLVETRLEGSVEKKEGVSNEDAKALLERLKKD